LSALRKGLSIAITPNQISKLDFATALSGLKRPKSWQRLEKDLDMIES
jgi:hypothetical protein